MILLFHDWFKEALPQQKKVLFPLYQHTYTESWKSWDWKEPMEVSSPASCVKHFQGESKVPRACRVTFWDAPGMEIPQPLWAVCPSANQLLLPTQSASGLYQCLGLFITGAELCMCSCWISWGSSSSAKVFSEWQPHPRAINWSPQCRVICWLTKGSRVCNEPE